jgi:hypothetical protein
MRPTRSGYRIPNFIIEIFVLSLFLAIIVELREQSRRKTALEAAQTAYLNARTTRDGAEEILAQRLRNWRKTAQPSDNETATIAKLQDQFERARADELARKAERDRLKAMNTGMFW